MNAYQRIRKGMKDRENWILKVIRRDGLYNLGIPNVCTFNALERLETRKIIRYHNKFHGYIFNEKR